MRLGIKAKQVATVTGIVGLVVVALSLLQLASLARLSVQESRERALLLVQAIYHRAFQIVPGSTDPYEVLRNDPGLRSILEAANYSRGLTYAAIVDRSDFVIAHSDSGQVQKRLRPAGDLDALLQRNGLAIYRVIRSSEGENLEVHQTLLLAGSKFGAIRVGVSTLLVGPELDDAMKPAFLTALAALGVAVVVSMFLAQLFLRPIHVIRGALSRLGQGEFGLTLDMPQKDEFGELGTFFNTLSAQLTADRSVLAGEKAKLESVVDRLEDAVAIFNPAGELLFANPAMRQALPENPFGQPVDDLLPDGHPFREIVQKTLSTSQSTGPVPAAVADRSEGAGAEARAGGETDTAGKAGERLLMTHAIKDQEDRLVGAMLVARNLDYLSRVQSTINYSRKLVALGRLSAGVAHEVKNPLNAIIIHLELLKQKLSALGAPAVSGAAATESRGFPSILPAEMARPDLENNPRSVEIASAMEHVTTITSEIRRLDEVMQGFLKFTRPEDLKLQAIDVRQLVDEVVRIVGPEAAQSNVRVDVNCPSEIPGVRGDPAMLRQALLNLAINACQAMPGGGQLRLVCSSARNRRVELRVEDTGVGISPQNLEKIFNLYFTTKPKGSGIGLSMVYRTVQLHDGEIEVQSTPGHGTTFRLLLPRLD